MSDETLEIIEEKFEINERKEHAINHVLSPLTHVIWINATQNSLQIKIAQFSVSD